jgi:hypothetical protein
VLEQCGLTAQHVVERFLSERFAGTKQAPARR